MRIFSIQNMLLLAFMMLANGNIMDHVPNPLRQLLGKGTAIAMSDKFDMNAMLLQMDQQRTQGAATAAKRPQPLHYQPYNFARNGADDMSIKSLPFPKEKLEQAFGNNEIPPAVREEVNAIFAQVLGGMQHGL